ncbi:MAG: hypothetical protein SGJ11_07770 [Phycisphaerae bacterium]|nr:hypothetical protein [Phycisphaerae bacterium]
MIPLVSKDLRLSLDAIRPIVLLITGFLLVGFLVTGLAPELRPDSIRAMDLGDLLLMMAGMIAVASPFIAGWCAAAVFVGDRGHRAWLFASVMPVHGTKRVVARLVTLLPALRVSPGLAYAGDSIPTPMTVLAFSALGVVSVAAAAMHGARCSQRSWWVTPLLPPPRSRCLRSRGASFR